MLQRSRLLMAEPQNERKVRALDTHLLMDLHCQLPQM